jgi:hypothetical protein
VVPDGSPVSELVYGAVVAEAKDAGFDDTVMAQTVRAAVADGDLENLLVWSVRFLRARGAVAVLFVRALVGCFVGGFANAVWRKGGRPAGEGVTQRDRAKARRTNAEVTASLANSAASWQAAVVSLQLVVDAVEDDCPFGLLRPLWDLPRLVELARALECCAGVEVESEAAVERGRALEVKFAQRGISCMIAVSDCSFRPLVWRRARLMRTLGFAW